VRRASYLTLFLAVLGAILRGQIPEPNPSSDAKPLALDVIVTDGRGAAVTNLKTQDFELLDSGQPVSLESAVWIAGDGRTGPGDAPLPIATPADERAAAERGGARLFGIFLDEYHVGEGPGTEHVRELLTDFIEHLGPRDLVVLAKPLDSIVDLQFTSDRDRLAAAVSAFEPRKGRYEPRGDFERNFIAGSPERIEAVRSQIATSMMAALATHLNSLGAGRRTLLVVSEGFARPPRRRDQALPSLESVTRAANHGMTSIYTIDPRALDGSPSARDADGLALLRTLATETGGTAMVESRDLGNGLRPIASDAAGYYLLTFGSGTKPDGRFHALQVKVKRPNVTVRARSGYWLAAPQEPLRLMVADRTSMFATGPPTHSSPLIRPWFGVARGVDGEMQVSFVWEPAARVPGERAPASRPQTIAMKATHANGTVVFQSEEGTGSRSEILFDTPPGRVRVELAIRDAASRLLDTDVRDVIVGALAGPVEVGTAEVLRSMNAKEYREIESDPAAAPVASREFSRAERLLIRIPAYGSGAGFAVTARLQSKLGNAMRALTVMQGPSANEYQVDLPLAGLAVGEYSVAVTATSSAGDAKDTVSFRVTP